MRAAFRTRLSAGALALTMLALGAGMVRSNQMPPLEGALKTAIPGLPAERAAGEAPRSWLHKIFAQPAGDPRTQAIAQLEAVGLSLDANSCNRAVAAQNRRLIELFLASGFDLNAQGERARTPLLTAAAGRHWALVSELLKMGANPNLADETGVTALMAASAAEQPAPLEELLRAGADVKARDARGHTALHYAVTAQRVANVTTLLARQSPVSGACCQECDLLTHAFETGRKEIILPVLEAQASDLEWTTEARTLLTESIKTRDQGLTKLLLSKYAGEPTPEGKEQPLLGYALLDNDLETFKYLLECGADANALLNSPVEKEFSARVPSSYCRLYLENETGMTALMLAAGMEKTDFVRALLERGARRGLLTAKFKMAALYFAAHTETPEIMQMLISEASPAPEQLRIEISLGSQKLNLLKNGTSIFTAPVSTGRTGFSTPSGRFVVTDKHLTHTSTIYKTAQMPFFMRLNCRDFGMHQGQLPGYPASHGCIRLPGSAAQKLYKDVPVGTLVSITR